MIDLHELNKFLVKSDDHALRMCKQENVNEVNMITNLLTFI